MATVKKSLTAAEETIVIDLPTDRGGIAGVQYGVGGQGTLVLEGTIDETGWFGIQMLPPAGGAGFATLAAAGAGYADVSYCEKIRVRKSVAGAGPVIATLTVSHKG